MFPVLATLRPPPHGAVEHCAVRKEKSQRSHSGLISNPGFVIKWQCQLRKMIYCSESQVSHL